MYWDSRDEQGRPVVSGRYYCQVQIGDLHLAQVMLVLR